MEFEPQVQSLGGNAAHQSEAWIIPLHQYGLWLAAKYTTYDPAIEAEDILQETWASAYTRIAGIADATERKKFLAACIRNQANHVYRRRKRRFELPLSTQVARNGANPRSVNVTLGDILPAPSDLVEHTLAAIEIRELIAQAQAGDSIVACALLVAAFGQEHAMAHLGIPVGTAGSRVARFRARPREVA